MRHLVILAVLASIGFAGCATVSKNDYNRGAASEDQFDKDAATCDMEAQRQKALVGLASWDANGSYNKMYDACMRSKGYKGN